MSAFISESLALEREVQCFSLTLRCLVIAEGEEVFSLVFSSPTVMAAVRVRNPEKESETKNVLGIDVGLLFPVALN